MEETDLHLLANMDDAGIWEPWKTYEILTDATGPYIRSVMLGLCGV